MVDCRTGSFLDSDAFDFERIQYGEQGAALLPLTVRQGQMAKISLLVEIEIYSSTHVHSSLKHGVG